jgi:hypothetical protein
MREFVFTEYDGEEYILSVPPVYPVRVETLHPVVSSEFDSGLVSTRPKFTVKRHKLSMSFYYIRKTDKDMLDKLWDKVRGQAGTFTLYMDERNAGDSDENTNELVHFLSEVLNIRDKEGNLKERMYVKFASPITFELVAYDRWNVSLTLEEDIGYGY